MTTGQGAVYLVGFMGAGKSSVGRPLARLLGREFIDLDLEIESISSKSITRIFAENGEEAFRSAERRALLALETTVGPVVATGGGICISEDNRQWMKQTGITVWLRCALEELYRRFDKISNSSRPLWSNDMEALTQLFQSRLPTYARADFVVDVDRKTPDQVALEIVRLLG